MKKRERIFTLLLAFLLVLSGCGKKEAGAGPADTGPSVVEAEGSYAGPDNDYDAAEDAGFHVAAEPSGGESQDAGSDAGPAGAPDLGYADPGPTEQEPYDPGFYRPVSSVADVPEFSGEPYVAINSNIPKLGPADLTTEPFEEYSELDKLGRCGVAYANICLELMPDAERGDISSVKPSGWHNTYYEFVDGGYVYNRCHLIGFQLAGENANAKNLITGTRYLNIEGMLPFENMVADYVKSTGNHVLYRVTPVFEGSELVCRGVQMEAFSVEDGGTGVSFNVFAYNAQPGVEIDYATGYTQEGGTVDPDEYVSADMSNRGRDYVLNTRTKKFHDPSCGSASTMSPENRSDVTDTRENLVSQGYEPCGICNP